MRFAIFLRKGKEPFDAIDKVPDQLRTRPLAVRGFDANGMMLGHELVKGESLEGSIERMFGKSGVAYLHIHFASPGCYAARVERA
jgi:hypothetical protein